MEQELQQLLESAEFREYYQLTREDHRDVTTPRERAPVDRGRSGPVPVYGNRGLSTPGPVPQNREYSSAPAAAATASATYKPIPMALPIQPARTFFDLPRCW